MVTACGEFLVVTCRERRLKVVGHGVETTPVSPLPSTEPPAGGTAARGTARTTPRRALTCTSVVLAGLTLTLGLLGPGAWSAQAEPASEARSRATAARTAAQEAAARVADVQAALDAQRDAFATAVSASIGAEVSAQAERRRSETARARTTQRIRSLYMDAGVALTSTRDFTILASVARGSAPSAALRGRDIAVGSAATGDRRTQAAADADAARAQQDSGAADEAALDAVAALRDLAAESSALAEALSRAQAQVTALDAEAARLQAAEDAAAALEQARAAAAALAASAEGAAAGVHARAVPADYATLYAGAAATCPGMRTSLLTAVGQVESGHGRNVGPSSAGAVGPMQFMPATFASYGVDGDGDGTADAWNPADAVYSAARYLCANGGGKGRTGEQGALFRYNHADWYVAMVQRVADELDDAASRDG